MTRWLLARPQLRPLGLYEVAAVAVFWLCIIGCAKAQPTADTRLLASVTALPLRVDHVTIVIMENKSYEDIIGDRNAPYINSLAARGVLFTNSFAVTHPSEPNYLVLYSGSTHSLTSDACPLHYPGPSLGGELIKARQSIKGYMEDLPAVGSPVCRAGVYARKHNPLINFADTPPQSVVPYSQITADMAANRYPTVAFVIPNLLNDMHDGTIGMGDRWLATNLPAILDFDATHHGVLILTWDEDDRGEGNHIPTIAVGPMLPVGRDSQRFDHYAVLSSVTDLFRLPALDNVTPVRRLTFTSPP